jgi:hypothetical protein
MFSSYERVVLRSRLAGGLSGSNVYMVRSIRPNAPDLPSVVKIDLYERIQQEWDAYKSCIQYRLPNVAEIRGEPVNPMGSIYSGLWYPLAGAGVDGIDSLQNFLLNTPAENIGPFLERRLFRRFAALWQQASIGAEYNFRTTYDEFLPLNLVIDCTTPVGQPGWLSPETYNGNWPVGDYVNISGFKVVKLLRKKQGLSLDIPDSHKAFRIHVYGVENAGEYEIGQIIQRPFSGLIKETRQRALKNLAQNVLGVEVNLEESVLTSPDGRSLPNPLTAGLAPGVEGSGHLRSTERAVRQQTPILPGEGNALRHALVDDVDADLGQPVDIGLAGPEVAALHRVVEQTEDAVAVVPVVLGRVDAALGRDAVRPPR